MRPPRTAMLQSRKSTARNRERRRMNVLNVRKCERGLSLVEIMVAVVIGMIGILVIMQVFLVYEGQKRTTTGVAGAQENGLVALFTLERQLRVAGLGLVGLGCTSINAYNENASPQDFTLKPWPASIEKDDPVSGTDKVTILYSGSAYGNIPTTITSPMPDSSAIFNIKNGDGFIQGELVLISEPPKNCSIVQASQNGQKTATTWNLQHNPGGAYVYNPPGGHNIFPAGGYGTGARLTNMGTMVHLEYFVQNDTLMVRDLIQPDSATNPVALVADIIAIRAQYGRDSDNDGYADVFDTTDPASQTEVLAVRLAMVARSGQFEKEEVSPATLTLWPGGTVADGGALELDADARHYRYKVYQTTVPLRNVIWKI